ncbi:MAG: gephyrin-like molybdotransferase Glp [Halobacteriota archaeon]
MLDVRKEFRDLASVEEAREVAKRLTPEPGIEEVSLREALGLVVAETLHSSVDVPGFTRSLMDGYAVRARDTYGADEASPASLAVVGSVTTGEPPGVAVGEGEAAEIATGAPLPEGADAVVPVERTARVDDAVRVRTSLAPDDNVMHAGSDVAAGQRAISAGTLLTQREIGLAAATGTESVSVFRRPRVGVVSTGDELVRPGDTLSTGQIHDVNTYSVAAAVEASGGEPVVYPHVEDDYDRMVEVMFRAAEECDVVLSSGSTSASDEDVVYRVVERHGELVLHGVSLKPGRPTVFGRLSDTPFVGLPGNPISALSVYRLFVSGIVRDAAGRRREASAEVARAVMADDVRTEGGRTRLLPVGLVEDAGGALYAYSVDRGSGATTSLTLADGFVSVDPETNYLAEAEPVEVSLFGELDPPGVVAAGETDAVVDKALEAVDGRWLSTGSVEAARRLRDGVVDLAVVASNASEVEEAGVSGAKLLRGYSREIGFVGDPDSATVYGVLPEGHALRQEFDGSYSDAEVRVRRSEQGLVDAVDSGDVDSALVGADVAPADAEFHPSDWMELDILVRDDRSEKPDVEGLLKAVSDVDLEAYRLSDGFGETIEHWE